MPALPARAPGNTSRRPAITPGAGPRLLVSVRDAAEAATALAGGADVIDVKEPAAGALGAADAATLAAVVAAVAGRRIVSATTGDIPPEAADAAVASARAVAASGADYVKVGLFPGPGRAALIDRLGRELGHSARLAAVLFADRGYDPALVSALAAAGFCGLVVDTADKRAGRLTDHLDTAALAGLVAACHHHGLFVGLAGSLRQDDLAPLAALGPDLLGVRGAAAAAGDRIAGLDATRLAGLVATLAGSRPAG